MKPFKPPIAQATRAIIVVSVAVQMVVSLLGPAVQQELILRAGLIPARLMGEMSGVPGSAPAMLTPLTSLFLHGGWLHLAFNLLFLAYIGRPVEWIIGPVRLLLLYIIGGLAGGVLQTVMQADPSVPVVGASGAVAAVFACYALLFARQRAAARRVFRFELSSETATAIWFAAVWIGLQLLTGAVTSNVIAIWSHIGGFVVGLLFTQPLLHTRQI